MNSILVATFLVVLAGIVYAAPQTYSTKFDNIDVDAILSNDRVLTAYVNCILDKGPCTAEGREFRKNLPDALATSCSKCSKSQKTMIKKASSHLIANRKADWAQISKKYDPKGEHSAQFKKFLAEP